MGIRDSYENGVFSWVDLLTTDPEAAKAFYSQLFNWKFQDMPVPDAPPYSMAFKNERSVAALFLMPEDMRSQNIPPYWQSYINVEDLDASVKKCEAHGATIIDPPCDIMEAGRMAIIKDPTEAMVILWQAKEHIGAGLVNEVNTFCWAELQTRGADKAVEFYKSVFGWDVEVDDKPPFYMTCSVKGHYNCGIFDMDKVNLPANIPSHWAVYFNVENLDNSLELVKDLGGKALIDPVEIDPGRFATISDPQGAVVTLMEINDPDD